MSLSTRLTVALSLAALIAFGAIGAWQLRAEAGDLRRATERELRLLGRSLQVSFENALRDRQEEDVEETLRELERIDPEVDVFVYDSAGARIAASSGASARPRWVVERPEPSGVLRFVPEGDPRSIELVLPLRITRDERPATMVVVRPLDEMRADLEATRRRVVVSVAGFVLLVALLTLGLARVWVGRPLSRMIAAMRRVRAGDLTPSRAPSRRDEIGATLREFEALVRDLADARARLEEEAEARRRLGEMLRQADKLATIGQLAAGLAHEIGSPLQVLEGRVAGLESRADDPGETRRVARILLEQTQRITRIVSRLGGLARRGVARRVREIEIAPPVRTVVELLDGEARRRGVTLVMREDGEPRRMRGDADAIQQLALNLLRNALDATERGGRVVVSVGACELRAPDGRLRDAVRIAVADTGRGMDEETRARVFDPFFTTREAAGGSGLGLAVVKGIVDEHRGRIEVRTRPGEGTTFTVELPLEPGAGPVVDGEPAEEPG